MALIARISNEAYDGSHKIHKENCPLVSDIPDDDRYIFNQESDKDYDYLDTIDEIRKSHPTFNSIPCSQCLDLP